MDARVIRTKTLMSEIPETPPCYLTTNQSEDSPTPASLPQISPIKTLRSKSCESLSLCSMNCLLSLPDPAVSLSAPDSNILVCLALLCIRHVNLGLITGSLTLLCMWVPVCTKLNLLYSPFSHQFSLSCFSCFCETCCFQPL